MAISRQVSSKKCLTDTPLKGIPFQIKNNTESGIGGNGRCETKQSVWLGVEAKQSFIPSLRLRLAVFSVRTDSFRTWKGISFLGGRRVYKYLSHGN